MTERLEELNKRRHESRRGTQECVRHERYF